MPLGEKITVAIIDDNRLFRESLTMMLHTLPDVRAAASALPDPAFLAEVCPDIVLLDVGLCDSDRLSVAAALGTEYPRAKIIAMDFLPATDEIAAFVNVGVSAFVLKDASFDDVVGTIRAVARGKAAVANPVSESMVSSNGSTAGESGGQPAVGALRLTPREREVIDLISAGLSNREIAARLKIASHTVTSHVRNVMEKLALHTRLQIAAYSHRSGAVAARSDSVGAMR